MWDSVHLTLMLSPVNGSDVIVTVCAHEMNAGISHCSIHGSLCVDDGVGSEALDSLLGCSSFTLLCRQLLGWRSTQHHYTHMSMYTCTHVYREFLTIMLTTLGSLSNNVKFWVWSEIGWCYGNTSVAMSLTCDRSCRCRQTSLLICYTILKYIFI